MATLEELSRLARRIVGRDVQVQRGKGAYTDGTSITVIDPQALWPGLPEPAIDSMDRFLTGHEASHIAVLEKEAQKRGLPAMSAKEFYNIFADPFSPDVESIDYVRALLNIVEDRPVDNMSAKVVGENRRQETNRFFVWNRQGGQRPSIAEYESQGKPGMCAAFIEAVFQIEVYQDLVESFFSAALKKAAKEAISAIDLYGQGAISRTQALQRVIAALKNYCSPSWSLPPKYQPPRGQNPQEGSGAGGQGQGQGSGEGQGISQGEGEGEGDGQGEGESGEGQPGQTASEGSEADGDFQEKEDEGSESEGSGQSSPSDSSSRGTGTGDKAGNGSLIQPIQEKRYENEDMEALLRTLERVLAERSRETGRGQPTWKTWSPGDQISSPDEIARYWEDEMYGIDPLERRAVRLRQKKRHLLAIFIDSSASVGNDLFAMLYQVCEHLAERVADIDGCFLGVGQFSGGAAWVLEPTRNVSDIRDFASQTPRRLFSGNTVVGEIYKVIPTYFAEYQSADLVVLTDGEVEQGPELAASLEAAHDETGCMIKLHGVIFRKRGIIKRFEKAKDMLPQHVRVWHIGRETT